MSLLVVDGSMLDEYQAEIGEILAELFLYRNIAADLDGATLADLVPFWHLERAVEVLTDSLGIKVDADDLLVDLAARLRTYRAHEAPLDLDTVEGESDYYFLSDCCEYCELAAMISARHGL